MNENNFLDQLVGDWEEQSTQNLPEGDWDALFRSTVMVRNGFTYTLDIFRHRTNGWIWAYVSGTDGSHRSFIIHKAKPA